MKELNKVNMRGVLPSQDADPIPVGKIPDGGTQVSAGDIADNDSKELILVSDGETLYLCGFTVSMYANVNGYGYLAVTNATDVVQYYLGFVRALVNVLSTGLSSTFFPPLEIPEKWKVIVAGSGVGAKTQGFVHGYEM